MKLYDLVEPSSENTKTDSRANSVAIGIDLGTTNSLVAVSKNGSTRIIGDLLPSVIALQDNKIVVGVKALELRDKIISVKRYMNEAAKPIFHSKTPVELSAEILKSLKIRAEDFLSEKVTQAVITVPAYFDENARQATKDAARVAGLDVLRLINEPTAAAIAYGLDKNEDGIFAIYDLGGGTFDITVLRMYKGVFQVLATGGDSHLGGDDFDKLLASKIFSSSPSIKELLEARKLKENLSNVDDIDIVRIEFESLIRPLVDRTLQLFENCIKDAEINPEEIKEIILVGGSTRIPMIKKLISERFGKAPLDSINPDEIVANGAALQAEALTTGSNSLLLDVTPLSLGVEVADGLVEKIIHRNSPIPIAKKQTFTTQIDNQTGFKIHVLQGEGERVPECRSLARFELRNLPALPAGAARLEINFQIDADGLLSVSARELSTNIIQEISVKPSYGLTEDEILRLILTK